MTLPPLSPAQRVKPPGFELRVSLIYAAVYAPLGVHLPYFPLWLEANGFDAAQIAVILSAPMFLRVLTTPLVTAAADKARDRLDVFTVVAVVALAASLGYFLPPAYLLVLCVSIVLALFWTPQGPLADSLALSGMRRWKSDYASMRIWGSIAFLVANFAGGAVISAVGARAVPWMISVGLGAVLVAVLAGPRIGRPRVATPGSAAMLPAAASNLFERRFLFFVAGAGFVNASHALVYGFSAIYWTTLGIDAGMTGALWAFSVICEVVVFGLYRRVFGRLSPGMLLVAAGAVAALRWALFPFVWASGAGVAGFFTIQALHAFSTGFLLIGVQMMIAEVVPEERTGAAQGIAFFANGLTMAAATLASGPLYAAYGVNGFLAMAMVAVAGTVLVAFSLRSSPKLGAGG